jgi:2-keto-3-deoxy-L-rhamnonate aldolase RhmA
MKSNRVKELLQRGEVTLGPWITIGHPDVVEMLAHMGFDWMAFDMEHAPLDIRTVQNLMQAANGTEVTPFVRVAWNDIVLIKQVLDLGTQGLVIPWVNTREDAIRAVRAARYPPQGLRGAGPRRAALYGLDRDYMAQAAAQIMIIAQIETTEAVENAENILEVEGVDGFFIGPTDLSTSMSIPGQRDHPELQRAIRKVLEIGKKLGKPGGIMCHSINEIKRAVDDGFKFIAAGSDFDYLKWGADIALGASGRSRKVNE